MPKNDGKTPQMRFNELYEVDPVTGCWNWTAGLNSKGYGYLWVPPVKGKPSPKRGHTLQAYKLAYVWKYGPVPEGMELDHECRNTRCVNPDHVKPKTRRQNQLNSDKTFPAINAAKTRCPRGHPYTGTNNQGRRICSICERALARLRKTRKAG